MTRTRHRTGADEVQTVSRSAAASASVRYSIIGVRFAIATLTGILFGLGPLAVATAQTGFASGHPLMSAAMPPGQIASAHVASNAFHGATLVNHVQPVRIVLPDSAEASMPVGHGYSPSEADLQMGLMIGPVYRFRITGVPLAEGAELYPTLEIVDRTYPPPGMELRHPIRIDIDREDLDAALGGQMVTRVIYLEDTETASTLPQDDSPSRPLEAGIGEDPLDLADALGRPVAIVRIGSVLPPSNPELLNRFHFGYPVWYPIHHDPNVPAVGVGPVDQSALHIAPEASVR